LSEVERMQVIYADTLFLINFVVNYLILLATAKVAARRTKRLRLALAAAAGGVYSVLTVFPALGFLTSVWIKLAAAVIMLLISFGSEKGILRTGLIFFAISAAFGGAVFAISLLTGRNAFARGLYISVSLKVLILSFALCYAVISVVFSRLGKAETAGGIVRVELRHRGAASSFTALRDSGNSLRDPMTGGGVIVAEWETVLPLFSEGTAKAVREGMADPLTLLQKIAGGGDGLGFYLLPYNAVGVGSSFLLAFRPEEVWIEGKRIGKSSVALSPTRVSDGGIYSALVNGGKM